MIGTIQTYSGLMVDPLIPNHRLVTIEDIAHALACKCRFTGHCKSFYSVAQHSVLVYKNCPPGKRRLRQWALLHDAAEAYLPDVAAPIKDRFEVVTEIGNRLSFVELELRWQAEICFKFDLPPLYARDAVTILNLDKRALVTEQRELMPPGPKWESLVGYDPFPEGIAPLYPPEAEAGFLLAFREAFMKELE